MKNLFIALLIGSVLLMPAVVRAESAVNPASDYTTIKTYTVVHDRTTDLIRTSATGSMTMVRTVPTTTISTNAKIIGYTLTVNTPAYGAVCSLHDVNASANTAAGLSIDDVAEQTLTNTTIISEAEVGADPGSVTVWFPYPKKLTYQLAVMIGQAYATVTIYYIA